MSDMDDPHWQQPCLWKTAKRGENPVENLARGRDSTSLSKDKSLDHARDGDIVVSLMEAVDVLSARVELLETQTIELIAALDKPLDFEDLTGRIQALKKELYL